ncbi:MAG: hypothetical protein LBV34_06820 [Nocardiopsaceae bacterium]|jgi:hypothetical protein|nr:hypothetical protein [Nocardiopsaceae bacterium]
MPADQGARQYRILIGRSAQGRTASRQSYREVVDRDVVIGNESPADGMHIAVRLRRDFTITDAERLLALARAAYIELNPGTTEHEAAEIVTSAADAIFTILEQDGLLGRAIDSALASHAEHGLRLGGWRAQVTIGEKLQLPPGPDCFDRGDVFALPVDT